MRSVSTRWQRPIAALAAAIMTAAHAAPPPLAIPISTESPTGQQVGGFSGYLDSLKRSNFLLGDLFGLRPALSENGISLALQETSESLGNVSGGSRRGFEYDGLTQMILQLDTQRAFGHYGGLFNVSALQVHGQNLSADNLGTLQTASGIEADRATRLWELWYDQRLLDEGRLDIRIGQQSVDQEFLVSSNAAYFVNTMFGWPALPSYDLPGGGPAYPLSVPGVRVKWRPINAVNILVGVYNGRPVRNGVGDPQRENAHGTQFPLHGGVLAFTELQFVYPTLGGMDYPDQQAPLSHTYKVGAWYDSEAFADQARDEHGLPLANPASDGVPAMHRGNLSLYGVADQMLWRSEHDPNHTINAFVRVMGTPWGDRNLVGFSANAGLVIHEPFRNRADDTFGLGMGYARVGSGAINADRDTAEFAAPGTFSPVRSGETYVEATYQYQVRPWWQVQPDVQYVINPGGGVADPAVPNRPIGNELVLGVRTNILF